MSTNIKIINIQIKFLFLIIIEKNLVNIKNSDYYRLFRYPWYAWFTSFLLFVCDFYLSYIIYYYQIRSPWALGMNIIIYWIIFFFTYLSEIEKITIDKKVNIFLF